MDTLVVFLAITGICITIRLFYIIFLLYKGQKSNYSELSDRRNKFRELDPSLPHGELFHHQPNNVRFVGRYKPIEPFFSKEQIHALYTVLKGESGVYLKWASGVLFFVKRNGSGDVIEIFPWQEKNVDKLNLFLKTPIKADEYKEFIERKCKELLEGRIIAPLSLKEKESNSTNAPSYKLK